MLRICFTLILGLFYSARGLNYGFRPHPVPLFHRPPIGLGTVKLKPIHLKTEIRFPDGRVEVIGGNRKGGYGGGKKFIPENHPIGGFGKGAPFAFPMKRNVISFGKGGPSKGPQLGFFGPRIESYPLPTIEAGPEPFPAGLGPVMHPGPIFQPGPIIQPGPVIQTGPIIQPGPVFQPGPVVQPSPIIEEAAPVDAGTIVVDAEAPKQGFDFKNLGFQGGSFGFTGNFGNGFGKDIDFGKFDTGKVDLTPEKPVDGGTVVVDVPGPDFGGKGFIPTGNDKIDKGKDVPKQTRPIENVGKPVDAGTVVIDVGPDGLPLNDKNVVPPVVQPLVPPVGPVGPIVDKDPVVINGGRADLPVNAIPDGIVPTFPAFPNIPGVVTAPSSVPVQAADFNNFEQRFSGVDNFQVVGDGGLAGVGGVGGAALGGAALAGVGGAALGGAPGGFIAGNVINDGAGVVVNPALGVELGPEIDPRLVSDNFDGRFGVFQEVGPNLSGVSIDNVDPRILAEIPNESLNTVNVLPAPATSAFVGAPDAVVPVVGGDTVVVQEGAFGGAGALAGGPGAIGGAGVVGSAGVVADGGFVGGAGVIGAAGALGGAEAVRVAGSEVVVNKNANNGGFVIGTGPVNDGRRTTVTETTVIERTIIGGNGGGGGGIGGTTVIGGPGSVVDIPNPIVNGQNSLVDIPVPINNGIDQVIPVDNVNIINVPPPSSLDNAGFGMIGPGGNVDAVAGPGPVDVAFPGVQDKNVLL